MASVSFQTVSITDVWRNFVPFAYSKTRSTLEFLSSKLKNLINEFIHLLWSFSEGAESVLLKHRATFYGGLRMSTSHFRPSSSGSGFLSKIKTSCGLSSTSGTSGRGRSRSSVTRVRHGFHLIEGKSGHDMEDYHVAEYKRKKNLELGLFAIFDGHLGDRVPYFLTQHLFNNILDEPNFMIDQKQAIRNAYHSTNKIILESSTQLGPGGSTAVTAIVIDGKDLWVANIGDSRAVVCERGSANQLTVDHEPRSERPRIEKQGGFVITLPGDVPRVNGQLAVARAFGDQNLKQHLSADPDVRHVPIDSTIEFLILASDGLWKVMNNQEAVDLIKATKDPQEAAKRLANEALTRKSKDDISCIVIRFG